jgi:hypothetical protein
MTVAAPKALAELFYVDKLKPWGDSCHLSDRRGNYA